MAVHLPSWFRLMRLHQGAAVICAAHTDGSETLSKNQKFNSTKVLSTQTVQSARKFTHKWLAAEDKSVLEKKSPLPPSN